MVQVFSGPPATLEYSCVRSKRPPGDSTQQASVVKLSGEQDSTFKSCLEQLPLKGECKLAAARDREAAAPRIRRGTSMAERACGEERREPLLYLAGL